MAKAKIVGMDWDFVSLFNEAVRTLPHKPFVKRDNIWASELMGDAYSRYLKMHAHVQSNPPNERSHRKFIMGYITEWIIEVILTVTGILQAKQLRGEVQLPNLLKVTGRLDFVAGGTIDWQKAKEQLEIMQKLFAASIADMPPIVFHAITHVFSRMEKMFTLVPLKEYIMEIKSCSGMIMKLIQKSRQPRPRHKLQPLHYLLANPEIKSAQLLYVSKDDAIMENFIITPTKDLLKIYRDDVQMMTNYYNNSGRNYLKNLPPKEPELIFEEDSFSFQKNMNVQYSNYLTFGWGYADFDEFEQKFAPIKASFNRTFRRHVLEGTEQTGKTGKKSLMKLTPANIETIKEAKKIFPEWDNFVVKAKKAGAFQAQEENEDD